MSFAHGHVPPKWHVGTVIPLLKSGNSNKFVLSSYEPIKLSSLFRKVFDLLVSHRHHNAL